MISYYIFVENMASVSRMKMLGKAAVRATTTTTKPNPAGAEFGAAVQANRGQWLKWPFKESVKETDVGVYGEEHKLARVDWDRIILFPGRWYFPPVTVKPKFEFWKYRQLKSEPLTEVLTEPKANSIFRMRNLYVAGGVLAIGGIGGIVYYVRRQQRKRFEAKVAQAAAESVRGAFQSAAAQAFPGVITQALQNFSVQDAFLEALQSVAVRDAIDLALQNAAEGAAVQGAIDQALQNAAEGAVVQDAIAHGVQNAAAQENVDVHGALVLALQDAVVKAAIGQAAKDAIAPVRTKDLTTKEVLKARLDAEAGKDMSLQTILATLDLEENLPTLQEAQVITVKDLLTSSVEKLVGSGILEAHAVKMKNAVSYLLDLHSPSFALA